MKLSVIVPTYNAEETLSHLLDSLFSQTHNNFEIIVVDDGSTDGTVAIARDYGCHIIALKQNYGPAHCRNIGAQNVRGDILAFIDSDCRADGRWLENIEQQFSQNTIHAIMGRLLILPSTYLGNSISALGFPAGGDIGFDKIWPVDPQGFTHSLSTCNCAVKRGIFMKAGGFDGTFPFPGGEDSFLAYNLGRLNYKIKYCPDVLVYHAARKSFRDFMKWQTRRGISSFIFSKKVTNKGDFVRLRLWSTGNILKCYFRDKKFPLVLFLLGFSLFTQLIGYASAKFNREFYERIDH